MYTKVYYRNITIQTARCGARKQSNARDATSGSRDSVSQQLPKSPQLDTGTTPGKTVERK